MAFIKFNDQETCVETTVAPVTKNVVRINLAEPNLSGFALYLDEEMTSPLSNTGEYDNYNTLYRQCDGFYYLSNDGSVYEELLPMVRFRSICQKNLLAGELEGELTQRVERYEDLVIPTAKVILENYEFAGWTPTIPTEGQITSNKVFYAMFTYIPSLEEVQEEKIEVMDSIRASVIEAGVDVTLSNGTTEHFSLTNYDQTSLMGLQTQVMAGAENIPWHNSDQAEHCKYYSNADMGLITQTAMSYVTYHVTYFRDLRIYIRSLETKEEVNSVFYGMPIPEEFSSQPLKDMVAAINA